jgi:uncharacterized protein
MQKSTATDSIKQTKFKVMDMQCSGCETAIEEAVAKLQGVSKIKADYPTGMVEVSFDADNTSPKAIQQAIEDSGYHIELSKPVKRSAWSKFFLALAAVVVLAMVMILARKLSHQFSLPDINSQLSDGMVFIVGLITGLHCIGMCGCFVINYTVRDAEQGRSIFFSHFLYGLGKTLSYAMFGAIFGLIGSMISITPFMKGITNLAAGGFLILFGLNMLGLFAVLKHVRIKQPKSLAHFAMEKRRQSRSPFFIGFFSGFLLGCGPLQAMYVMAAGSSEPLLGAKILTIFGLGTLPALFGFGFLTRLFSATTTQRFFQLSGVILIFVGTMMFNMGLIRTQSGYDFQSIEHKIIKKMYAPSPTPP